MNRPAGESLPVLLCHFIETPRQNICQGVQRFQKALFLEMMML